MEAKETGYQETPAKGLRKFATNSIWDGALTVSTVNLIINVDYVANLVMVQVIVEELWEVGKISADQMISQKDTRGIQRIGWEETALIFDLY